MPSGKLGYFVLTSVLSEIRTWGTLALKTGCTIIVSTSIGVNRFSREIIILANFVIRLAVI
jgi:hypothetical protein